MASPRSPRVLPPGVAHSRRAAMLMLAGLVAAGTPLPYTALAAVPLVWAGVESVLSIRDRVAARSTNREPGWAPNRGIVSSVVSLALVCLVTVVVLLPYAFYGPFKNRQDCTRGANTAIAAADCNTQFSRTFDSVLRGFLSSAQRAGG